MFASQHYCAKHISKAKHVDPNELALARQNLLFFFIPNYVFRCQEFAPGLRECMFLPYLLSLKRPGLLFGVHVDMFCFHLQGVNFCDVLDIFCVWIRHGHSRANGHLFEHTFIWFLDFKFPDLVVGWCFAFRRERLVETVRHQQNTTSKIKKKKKRETCHTHPWFNTKQSRFRWQTCEHRKKTNLTTDLVDTKLCLKRIFPDSAAQPKPPAHISQQTDGRILKTIVRIQSKKPQRAENAPKWCSPNFGFEAPASSVT